MLCVWVCVSVCAYVCITVCVCLYHCVCFVCKYVNECILLSYSCPVPQGVITKCVLPEAGIYELDSKVQLFLTHKPCLNLCRGLRVGATVQLDNIHPTKLTRKVHTCVEGYL